MAVDILGDGINVSAKGDIVGHDGTAPARIPVGSDGQILTAQSSATSGLVWATPDTSGLNQGYFAVASSVLTADTASITFSSITSGYTDLEIVGFCKTDSTTNGINALIQVNNISSGYMTTEHKSIGSTNATATITSTYSSSTGSAVIGVAPGSAVTDWAGFIGTISSYSDTSQTYKMILSAGGYDTNSEGSFKILGSCVSVSSAIDTIKIFPDSSKNWLSGSMFCLYARKK